MPDLHLLNGIAIALSLALAGGLVARSIGISPIVGYLLAGAIISPFTPGYTGDVEALRELAELGVIFLMFGVGLHFNLEHLAAVKGIAIPGAILQMAGTAALGVALGTITGLSFQEALLLGLAISVSSTVVLVRALEERGLMGSIHGQVAVGWLVVQDLATVLMLVLVPVLSGADETNAWASAAWAIGKAGIFLALMLLVGSRVVPWLLSFVARAGSRELFTLTVVVAALGIATGASVFGVSVALGAFVAGVVISETETSHQAAAEALPFREAFAVLFFVSVGMLLDPAVVRENLGLLAGVMLVVLLGKALLTAVIAGVFPYPARTALIGAVGLAQVGEFSFILADAALGARILGPSTYNVILAASVISIAVNPLMFGLLPRAEALTGRFWPLRRERGVPDEIEDQALPPGVGSFVLIAGYGRVGHIVATALNERDVPYIVVEARLDVVRAAQGQGVHAVWGDAARAEVLERAGVDRARLLVIAVPDSNSTLLTVANARRINPGLRIVARARDAADVDTLRALYVEEVIVPEFEGGKEMVRHALRGLGVSAEDAERYIEADDVQRAADGHTIRQQARQAETRL